MVMHSNTALSRRLVFQRGVRFAAAIAGGTLAAAGPAVAEWRLAQQKIAKTALMYQDKPKDGAKCSACVQFQPPNQCKLVEGDISPDGWCAAFSPKPS
jgi:hypothetical protein